MSYGFGWRLGISLCIGWIVDSLLAEVQIMNIDDFSIFFGAWNNVPFKCSSRS
jgi:hypothetical protein